MKTAKDWFEEELSGEPLTQESVIEVIKMVQKETWNEALDKAAELVEKRLKNESQIKAYLLDGSSILKLKI